MKLPYSLFLLIFLFPILNLSAQNGIKGQITDPDGQPLGFATIFVSNTGAGAVTNEEGFYEIVLSKGTHNVVFQYLGLKTLQKKIQVGNGMKIENFQFEEQSLEIETVEIIDGRENPAYTIMRKAIAKADYHRQQLESYSAQVYIKGSGRFIDVPWFLRKRLEKEGIDSTMGFVTESVNEIMFKRPDIFKEKVMSARQQGDDNSTNPMQYINSSFYNSKVAAAISPLSPKAFTYYRFEFEGSYFERDFEINKIKVTPRRKSEGVFEGTIYIVEDWWAIHSLDLKTYKLGFEIDLKQIYGSIQEKVWMPLTHKMKMNGSIMGFDFEANYLATTSDYKIELNPDLDADFKIIDEKIETELAAEIKANQKNKKTADLNERIRSGEPLTRKEMRKMMKQYRKDEIKQRKEERKNRKEGKIEKQSEPVVQSTRTFEIDSLASNKDSAFWESVRPLPLTSYELNTYKRIDSVAIAKQNKDTTTTKKKGKSSPLSNFFGTILMGNTYKISKKTDLRFHGSLLETNYNTVELWNTSVPISLRTQLDSNLKFSINPTYNIAFAPFVHDGNVELKLEGGKKFRKYKMSIDGGDAIFQFNPENPIDLLMEETWLTLFYEKNYAKFYQKKYLNGKINGQISDRLEGSINIEWADRDPLFNNDNAKSWRKTDRNFTSNNPFNFELINTVFEPHKAFTASANLHWFPFKKYMLRNGQKIVRSNSGPSFQATYRKGFDDLFGSTVDYDLFIAQINLDHEFPAGSRLMIETSIGSFFNKNNLYFPDFHHFRGNKTIIVLEEPIGNFRNLPYYKHSSGDEFFEFHAFHQFRNLLITQIPEAWMLGLKENLTFSFLYTPEAKDYFEIGYGLDNIYKFFRAEVGASFLNGKYQNTYFRVGISSAFNFSSDEDGEQNVSIGL